VNILFFLKPQVGLGDQLVESLETLLALFESEVNLIQASYKGVGLASTGKILMI
jgi:hypothetical protein